MENRFVVVKEEGVEGGVDGEFGVYRCKLLYIEWMENKVLLLAQGTMFNVLGYNINGKEYKNVYIHILIQFYIYTKLNHFAVQQKLTL